MELEHAQPRSWRRWVWVAIALLILALIGGLWILWHPRSVGNEVSDQDIERVVRQIRLHLLAPSLEEERPVVARVQDPKVLIEEQPFYQGVEAGDYLVVYPKWGKAILYSPSQHRIRNVGPLQFEKPEADPQSETQAVLEPPTPEEPVTESDTPVHEP